MGMIYRRKKRDPTMGALKEQGPYWMKYYTESRPIQGSTKTFDKEGARRILRIKEGEIAAGTYRGPCIDRVRFEDLAALVQQDYQINRRKTVRRITECQKHLEPYFRKARVYSITTGRIKAYIVKRQEQGAANGTINREIGFLKRMFHLGYQQTPQLVARIPHIPTTHRTQHTLRFF